jgi:hypothetical protein
VCPERSTETPCLFTGWAEPVEALPSSAVPKEEEQAFDKLRQAGD